MYNTNLDNGKGEVIKDEVVSYLEIQEVNEDGQYLKNLEDAGNICKIHLVHAKTPCNYSHCAFKVYYNNEEMSFGAIYDSTLGKNRKLRTMAKLELSRMYAKEVVRINW